MARCQADWSRCWPGSLTSAKRTMPCRSTRNVPRLAIPAVSLNTPYRRATSPCGQKSDSIGKR